jgi:sec-independent protein translocase protein TatC
MPQDEQDKTSVPEIITPAYDHPGGVEAHGYHDDTATTAHHPLVTLNREEPASASAPPPPPPPPKGPLDPEDEEDDGMLRMSFLDHLEELRSRIIKALVGLVVAYGLCLVFAKDMWKIVAAPAAVALTSLGFSPDLNQLKPMDGFLIIYFKLPLLASLFLASPWLLWQVWAFIAPGLYKKERNLAAPFVISTAGLFILGGLFAYFVAFRFGLTFLLGVGNDVGIKPVIDLTEYFDLFVNVMLGIGVTFELPVLIFFLTMLRIVTPGFLIEHSRYAIIAITVLAAVITPTPDIVNLLIFAIPMILLYFVGVFAGWLLVLSREGKKFPWHVVFWILGGIGISTAATIYVMTSRFGYKFIEKWPFLTQ